jgi:hypothetical protein
VRRELGLPHVPHFTTLQKAAAGPGAAMLHPAVRRSVQMSCPGAVFAGVDATEFGVRHHATPYCTRRANLRHKHAKVSVCSDLNPQLAMAVEMGRGPSADVSCIPGLIARMKRTILF